MSRRSVYRPAAVGLAVAILLLAVLTVIEFALGRSGDVAAVNGLLG